MKVDRKRCTGDLARSVSQIKPHTFLFVGLRCGGKPEARHQLIEATDEVTIATRKELVLMQWQHPVAQRLAACMTFNGRHFKHVL
jgi:hypothetical protein